MTKNSVICLLLYAYFFYIDVIENIGYIVLLNNFLTIALYKFPIKNHSLCYNIWKICQYILASQISCVSLWNCARCHIRGIEMSPSMIVFQIQLFMFANLNHLCKKCYFILLFEWNTVYYRIIIHCIFSLIIASSNLYTQCYVKYGRMLVT